MEILSPIPNIDNFPAYSRGLPDRTIPLKTPVGRYLRYNDAVGMHTAAK